jgi:hypothetical protein
MISFISKIKERRRKKFSRRKDFQKEEDNSCKYKGMIAMTLKCNEFIDTYEMIAMLLTLVVALMYSFL